MIRTYVEALIQNMAGYLKFLVFELEADAPAGRLIERIVAR